MIKRNSYYNEEIAGWDARQEFLRSVMELVNNMYLDKIDGNISNYRITFKQLLSLTEVYIEKHFTEEDKILFSMDDIKKLELKIPSGDRDYNVRIRNGVMNEIMELIEKKEKRLYRLLAIEKMFMPTHEKKDLGKSVFET